MSTEPVCTAESAAEPLELRRLRWRARRGLLENDLLIGRFLDLHGRALDAEQNRALSKLLELPDNDLLDLLLARSQPAAPLDSADVSEVLARLRAV
jgi:antitoxin CptB